jgi:antitoxin component YwqK of YwqJK toxin-antitoxin module
MVLGDSGKPIDTVRLYHQNGQLAEELAIANGKEDGPWLRFFQNGRPRLQAEHNSAGKPIIHNAWNEDGLQIVAVGTGTYMFDGESISPTYRVTFESDWRRVSEIRSGIQDGKTTVYHRGVLWAINNFVEGKQHGDCTIFWPNGRVRSKSRYELGKEVSSKPFDRFDKPAPAVLLTIEADERLYKAWRHMPLDQYPTVLNLDDVREQIQLPQFLIDVHQRNLDGKPKSDYENWNTFDDGIAYFITVDKQGRVENVKANGSGTYSGRDWNTYIPLLKQLLFEPGRVKGRAYKCQVLASVDHTFVEGA